MFRSKRRYIHGIPKKRWVKFEYIGNYNTDTFPNTHTKTLRLNSCYDPENAIGGRSPPMFKLYASQYNHAIVRRAKLAVTFNPIVNAAGLQQPFRVGILPADTTIGLGGINQYWYTYTRAICATVNQTGQSRKRLVYHFNPDSWGIKGDENKWMFNQSNPVEQIYAHIICDRGYATQNIFNVQVVYKITYWVEFFEPSTSYEQLNAPGDLVGDVEDDDEEAGMENQEESLAPAKAPEVPPALTPAPGE